jgi:hypothetical protein
MTLQQALMNSQDLSEEEADEMIKEMKERMLNGEDPEEILFDEGLEPDYVMDLLD